MSVAIAAIIVLETFTGGLLNLIALGDDVVYSKRTSYRNFIDRLQPIVDMVKKTTIPSTAWRKRFTGKQTIRWLLVFRGLSNSTSTLSTPQRLNFSIAWDFHQNRTGQNILAVHPVPDTLLELKYIIAEEDDSVSSLYDFVCEYDPGEAYANLNAYKTHMHSRLHMASARIFSAIIWNRTTRHLNA